jgi:5-methylcytosine-specific restriction endonuclease McrA
MSGDPFYSTPEWRDLRRRALKRDRYRCVLCAADLRKLGSSRVDHILSRRARPDLALVLANLRSLCASCDNRQSREKLEHQHGPRFERVDTDGLTAAWRDDPASK